MKTIFKYSFVLLILSTFFSLDLTSQTWENVNTPPGGTVLKIVENNNLLFAVTDFRLYKSSDEGMNWEEVKSKIDLNGVKDVISHRNNLFTLIYNKGVLRSTDNGDTWENLYKFSNYIESDGNNLYINNDVPLMSSNNGTSWVKPKTNFIDFDSISSLKIYNDSNKSYLAYTKNKKVTIYEKRKIDSIWQLVTIDSNLTNFNYIYKLSNLLVKDSIIIISFADNFNNVELFRSTNLGYTWTDAKKNKLFKHFITSFILSDSFLLASTYNNNGLDSRRGESMYLFKSSDMGNTWDSLYMGNRMIYNLFKYKQRIFASHRFKEGIISSTDNFSTFDNRTSGIFSRTINSITSNKTSIVVKYYDYSGLISGINRDYYKYFISSNEGLTWNELNDTLVNSASDLIAIGNDFYLNSMTGLYKSIDNCNTWERIGGKVFTKSLFYSGKLMLAQDNINYYFSSDFGITWYSSDIMKYDYFINSFTEADSCYYLLTSNNLYKNIPNSTNWTIESSNILNSKEYISNIFFYNNYLFGKTQLTAFRSAIYNFSTNKEIFNKKGGNIDFNILKSNKHLFLNKTNKTYDDFELFISSDNGDNWKIIQNGLYTDGKAAAIVHKNKTYLVSNNTGLWRTNLYETDVAAETKKEDKLLVYPNPASSFISIDNSKTEFNSNSLVTYSITDMEGKTLSTFQKFEPMFNVNTSDIPNGTYFLRAEQDKNCYLKIITIQK